MMFEKKIEPDVAEKTVAYHALSAQRVLQQLNASPNGLTKTAVHARIQQYGRNDLVQQDVHGFFVILLQEFKNPMIYVLLLAAVFSVFVLQWADAFFIGVVLLVNAFISAIQEYSSMKSSNTMRETVVTTTTVIRDDEVSEVSSTSLVPGDIVCLRAGNCVPADLRLFESLHLEIDESLLTGEHQPILKRAESLIKLDSPLKEKSNMAFAGTSVVLGQGKGVVVATGLKTAFGLISHKMLTNKPPKPPLLERLDKFTLTIAIMIGFFTLIMAIIAFFQGMGLLEIAMLATALAVSAIPEGLPMVLSGALAVSIRRMASQNILIKKILAVDALGSCTYLAVEKRGTLTQNQLSVKKIVFSDTLECDVTGSRKDVLKGDVTLKNKEETATTDKMIQHLCKVSVMTNEGYLARKNGSWQLKGNAMDTALLVMAHKRGIIRDNLQSDYSLLSKMPFNARQKFSAAVFKGDHGAHVMMKGAIEVCLPKCTKMVSEEGVVPIDMEMIQAQADRLALSGYRVIAVAEGLAGDRTQELRENDIKNLTLLGLVGAIDPIEPDAIEAIKACASAGVKTAMFCGDHPLRAFAQGRKLELVQDMSEVVSGAQLDNIHCPEEKAERVLNAKVFTRLGTHQKIEVIDILEQEGHFVGYVGEDASDAPVIKRAHIGIATGGVGSDVSRETADLVIANDRFSSLVAGIEQGRVAYKNIRKIIFLIISTSIAEIILFTLALLFALPIPLLPVQLLWLNLATNVIQDLALAFEPGGGYELKQKPRTRDEPIFNRIMIERVVISSIWMGVGAFLIFYSLLNSGMDIFDARNSTLLLMVLFANTHVFNSRSEKKHILQQNVFSNPILLIGTCAAQGVHMLAMYTPGLNDILKIKAVSFSHWITLLSMAATLLLVMECHKYIKNK